MLKFQKLPSGLQYSHDAALDPANKGKNRYKNMYACKWNDKYTVIAPYLYLYYDKSSHKHLLFCSMLASTMLPCV